jgi:protease IV
MSRPMTVEERRLLQTLLDDVHAQFVGAVAAGRKLDEAQVLQFADGRILSGAQAQALNMVDELGGLEDAIDRAGRLAGLAVPPRIVPPRRRFSLFDLLRNQLGLAASQGLAPALPVFKTPLYLMD